VRIRNHFGDGISKAESFHMYTDAQGLTTLEDSVPSSEEKI